jgi:GTP:adenosylcobinamide-phosphate guanylyltransferase
MYAIVTAGGIPQPGDPLYKFTAGLPKALLDLAGKPMIQWVLDALSQAASVEEVILVGLEDSSTVQCEKKMHYVTNQGGILQNMRAGVEKALALDPEAHHVLAVSSDIPAIKPEMVDWLVDTAMQTDDDIYYNVITRQVMEARFPNSKRSYIHLKNAEVCGGDMNMIRAKTVTGNDELWERIISARKSAFKQAALIGYGTLLLLLLRQLKVESGVKRVCERLNIRGRVLFCPFAEVGMDVDKPHQLEIMRADLVEKAMA